MEIEEYFKTIGRLLSGETELSDDPEVIAEQAYALYAVTEGLGWIPPEKRPEDFYKNVGTLYVQAYEKLRELNYNKISAALYNEYNFLKGDLGFGD